MIIEYVGTSFPKLHGMVYNDLKRLSITLHPVIIFHLLATPYLTIYSSLQQTHQNKSIKTIHHVQSGVPFAWPLQIWLSLIIIDYYVLSLIIIGFHWLYENPKKVTHWFSYSVTTWKSNSCADPPLQSGVPFPWPVLQILGRKGGISSPSRACLEHIFVWMEQSSDNTSPCPGPEKKEYHPLVWSGSLHLLLLGSRKLWWATPRARAAHIFPYIVFSIPHSCFLKVKEESALAFSNFSKINWALEGLWQASQRHNPRAGFERSR